MLENSQEVQKLVELVNEKNKAYGNSFNKVPRIIDIITEGMTHEQLKEALPRICKITRLLDKINRYIWQPGAFNEDEVKDMFGYILLLMRDSA